MDKVSNDVLLEIFKVLLAAHDGRIIQDIKDRRLVLAAVCRQWRSLIVDTPTFWKNIWITSVDSCMPSTGPALEEILRRSRNLPITVRLGQRQCPLSAHAKTVLTASVERWSSLEISSRDDQSEKFLEDYGFPRLLPRLQEVEVAVKCECRTFDIVKYLRPFVKCTGLERLSVCALPGFPSWSESSSFDVADLGFPWGRLVQLTLHAPMVTQNLLDVLRACVRLECLDLGLNLTGEGTHAIPPVSLPHLRTLDVFFVGSFSVLSSMRFPNLVDLGISAHRDILASLSETSPLLALRTLRLWHRHFDEDNLVSSFSSLDAMTSLPSLTIVELVASVRSLPFIVNKLVSLAPELHLETIRLVHASKKAKHSELCQNEIMVDNVEALVAGFLAGEKSTLRLVVLDFRVFKFKSPSDRYQRVPRGLRRTPLLRRLAAAFKDSVLKVAVYI